MSFARRLETLQFRSGCSNPKAAILTLARNLHLASRTSTPPFRPERFCELTSVEIDRVYLNDCDARLLPIRGGFIAEINRKHRRARQNFSVCHEVAHTFFFSEDGSNAFESVSCSESHSRSIEESLCDAAAAELLMPMQSFVAVASELVPSLDSVYSLADLYEVTPFAIAKRIKELDVWPCTFVYIQPVSPPAGPVEFRIKSYLASESAYTCQNGTRALVSALRFRLNMRIDDRLGLEEALNTGKETSTEFVCSRDRFAVQFRRYYRDGSPQIIGFSFHGLR